jgi:hypothetical protein
MYKKILLFFILIIPKLLLAQSTIFDKDPLANVKGTGTELQKHFIYHVKNLDEFIERFNNDSTSEMQLYVKKINVPKLSRETMIKWLFNQLRQNPWNTNDIKAFIKQVDNNTSPVYLNFLDDKWYANVTCSVLWEGKPKTITLKLKVEKDGNSTLKWVIFDIDAPFIATSTTKIPQPTIPTPVNNDSYLNPMSHNINFFSIDMVATDTKNIANYLASTIYYSNNLIVFINECLNHKIKIQSVRKVVFDFQQIKGWDFEVEEFTRPDLNSGWLVNKLTKVP